MREDILFICPDGTATGRDLPGVSEARCHHTHFAGSGSWPRRWSRCESSMRLASLDNGASKNETPNACGKCVSISSAGLITYGFALCSSAPSPRGTHVGRSNHFPICLQMKVEYVWLPYGGSLNGFSRIEKKSHCHCCHRRRVVLLWSYDCATIQYFHRRNEQCRNIFRKILKNSVTRNMKNNRRCINPFSSAAFIHQSRTRE